MADTIFISCRNDDSIDIVNRLHDRIAETFGHKNIFKDVSAPLGDEFAADLSGRDAVLVIIGPNWLNAKDRTGRRRLSDPDDFVVVEIAAAFAQNIRVIPVLVSGASMPKVSALPNPIQPLVRCNGTEISTSQFDRDAEELIKKIRDPLKCGSASRQQGRNLVTVGVLALVFLFLIGGGYAFLWRSSKEQSVPGAESKWEDERKALESGANRKVQEVEQQRLAALKNAEQERQSKATIEESDAYGHAILAGNAAYSAGGFDKAIANFSEAIQARPHDAIAFYSRGNAYESKGDYDRAIADYNEAIRLNPNNALAFNNRGIAYASKGNQFRAIADYNEAIRLKPDYAGAFCNRGIARQKINNNGDNDDKAKARQLDASACR
jgi:hypothetical protein